MTAGSRIARDRRTMPLSSMKTINRRPSRFTVTRRVQDRRAALRKNLACSTGSARLTCAHDLVTVSQVDYAIAIRAPMRADRQQDCLAPHGPVR